MLETSKDRIKILKTGLTQKQIEAMYIESNELRIVSLPLMFDIVEVEERQNKKTCETAVESAHSLGLSVVSIFNVSRFKTLSPIIHQ